MKRSFESRQRRLPLVLLAALAALAVVPAPAFGLTGIQKIQHVIFITQENRSFDNYFGTYPGAYGIPAGVCMPDPGHGGCVTPFHDGSDVNYGGPHDVWAFLHDVDSGRMDGFIGQAETLQHCSGTNPQCSPCLTSSVANACMDSMGYHDAREIPNYWSYAENYVLQDHMFESVRGWSWPAHLWQVSGWSAQCSSPTNPFSCTTFFNQSPANFPGGAPAPGSELPWTDITYLLYTHRVSWGYYIFAGDEPDCESDAELSCAPVAQGPQTAGVWNPLPYFADVQQDGQTRNIQSLNHFYTAVSNRAGCGLPNVSWIVPNANVSEHPPASITAGQAFVTTTINAIMRSPCWDSSAIFVTWDDWGGFYDSIVPPTILTETEGKPPVTAAGYGIRVPGLLISPYARTGYVDHQILSQDAYLKFLEADFLGGQPICATASDGTNQGCTTSDGRPDSRPQVAESLVPGNLAAEFNFSHAPRAPRILPTRPRPGPASCPPGGCPGAPACPALTCLPGTCVGPSCPVIPLWRLTVSTPRREHAGRRAAIHLGVGCDAACVVQISVTVSLSRHGPRFTLPAQTLLLPGGASRTVRLRLSGAARRRILRSLRLRRIVSASMLATATAEGTASTASRTFRIVR